MDEGIKMFYKGILNIDPDSCIAVPEDISKLEIEIGGERMGFEDFLKPRIRIVTIDHFSTKEIAEEVTRKSGAPDFLKQVYMELFRCYGAIEHNGSKVGIGDKIQVYNGYPKLINSEEFAENPQEVFKRGIDEMVRRNNQSDIMCKPEIFVKTNYWLSSEFLEQNPMYSVRKIWGLRVREERIGGEKNGP